MSTIVEYCTKIGQPIIEQMGYELVDVEYAKEGNRQFLRYYVDKEGGIDIEECALISEKIGDELDRNDPIKDEYMLEISSPGAEKPLKTKEAIKRSIGEYVYIKVYKTVNGMKEFEGDLVNFEDDTVTLEYKDKNIKKKVKIEYDLIAKMRLAIKF
ncbi:Ribosome maturation factor RimP protein [Haloplasma contractile SSD-17B]|uniref:Ribosome maturation factor RimP n=2 Tax=Haloplasma TaxID=471824 RepID=U2FLA5_9MOLU|nr:ribosome maturation factor RimP [Haloplasma contractile]ERJ13520.1 Ribosome maturation factor RimP protein [Haloplasma contractile SSD-17B]